MRVGVFVLFTKSQEPITVFDTNSDISSIEQIFVNIDRGKKEVVELPEYRNYQLYVVYFFFFNFWLCWVFVSV